MPNCNTEQTYQCGGMCLPKSKNCLKMADASTLAKLAKQPGSVLQSAIAEPGPKLVLTDYKNEPKAVARVEPIGKTMVLHEIASTEAGKGFGKDLLTSLLKYAKTKGYTKMHAQPIDDKAEAWFERQGFKPNPLAGMEIAMSEQSTAWQNTSEQWKLLLDASKLPFEAIMAAPELAWQQLSYKPAMMAESLNCKTGNYQCGRICLNSNKICRSKEVPAEYADKFLLIVKKHMLDGKGDKVRGFEKRLPKIRQLKNGTSDVQRAMQTMFAKDPAKASFIAKQMAEHGIKARLITPEQQADREFVGQLSADMAGIKNPDAELVAKLADKRGKSLGWTSPNGKDIVLVGDGVGQPKLAKLGKKLGGEPKPFSALNYDDPAAVFLHEFGHQVHYAMGEAGMAKLKSAIDRGSVEQITKYGSTNDREWFAEAFAAYMANEAEFKKAAPNGWKLLNAIVKQGYKLA